MQRTIRFRCRYSVSRHIQQGSSLPLNRFLPGAAQCNYVQCFFFFSITACRFILIAWDLRKVSSSFSIRQRRLTPLSKCTCRLTLMAHLAEDFQQSLITVTGWNRWSWYPARPLRWRPRFLHPLLNGTYILWNVIKVQTERNIGTQKDSRQKPKKVDMFQSLVHYQFLWSLLRSVYFETITCKNKSCSLYQVVQLVEDSRSYNK